jgi:hypothetical protein
MKIRNFYRRAQREQRGRYEIRPSRIFTGGNGENREGSETSK